jgi:ABC-type lipoprotein export system ATPase subunit
MSRRIARVLIQGLLQPDRDVDIEIDQSGFLLVCGDNGTGKSQLLNCIAELLSLNFMSLTKRYFSKLTIFDDCQNSLTFDKTTQREPMSHRRPSGLRNQMAQTSSKSQWTMADRTFDVYFNEKQVACQAIDSNLTFIGNAWVNRRTRERFLTLTYEPIEDESNTGVVNELRSFLSDLKVCFLLADRARGTDSTTRGIYDDDDEDERDPLEILSRDIAKKISNIRRDMVQNGSFLSKQISEWQQIVKDWDNNAQGHRDNAQHLVELLSVYKEAGILDATHWETAIYDSADTENPSVNILHFLQYEMSQQLKSQEKQVKHLFAFKKLLERYLTNKSVVLGDHGIRFEANGVHIPFSGLSSGERHIVMLWGRTMFIEDYGVLIIDEPEISLHPNWKESFLGDLFTNIGDTTANVFIATHSDKLVSGYHQYIQNIAWEN